jgi:hypothetical protein
LFRLDPTGLLLWDKAYGDVDDDRLDEIRLRADGQRLLLGGRTESYAQSGYDAWLIDVDTDGTPNWSRSFDDGADEHITAILAMFDAVVSREQGGFTVGLDLSFDNDGTFNEVRFFPDLPDSHEFGEGAAGWVQPQYGDKDLWLNRGTYQEIRGGSGEDAATASVHLANGGSIVVGYTESYGAGGSDVWVLRYSSTDYLAGEITLGGTGDDRPVDVLETDDGRIVVAATTTSFGAGGTDIWIIGLDIYGTVFWQHTYGGSDDDEVTQIVQTSDGGFLVSGKTYSYGSGDADAWLLKLDTNGAMGAGCPHTATPGVSAGSLTSSVTTSNEFSIPLSGAGFTEPTVTAATGSSAQLTQCYVTCPDADGDHFSSCLLDCDDDDVTIHAGAIQLCDGVNNDCDAAAWPAVPADEFDDDSDGVRICAGDCDDADATTYRDAPETNDGLDNQCPGDYGYGIIDELSGFDAVEDSGDVEQFCWPHQDGATRYQVARSADPTFETGCSVAEETTNCHEDSVDPNPGEVFYYVVRPLEPHAGSWGVDDTGTERVFTCGP